MRGLLSLILTLFLCLPSMALAQNDTLGFDVIDYDFFLQLDQQAQRDYIVLIMRTVTEMEAEIYFQEQNLKRTKENQKKKETVQLLKKLIEQFTLSEAYASASNKDCINAGWFSSYNVYRSSCPLPSSTNPKYQAARAACSGGKMPCNPSIFGLTTAGKPLCYDIARVKDINASLSCLTLFEKEPDQNTRIDNMIADLKKPENKDGRTAFNKTIQTIMNACVCSQNAPENGHNIQLADKYFDYMQGHRTCYSLVAQTQVLAQAFKDKNAANACFVINRENVDALATDLKVISTHWSTRRNAVIGTNNFVSVLGSQIYSIEEHKKKPPIGLQPQGKNLDKVSEIDNCIRRIQTGDTSIECALAGQPLIAKKHCPLELPPIEEDVKTECTVAVKAGVIETGKMNFEATLTIRPNDGLKAEEQKVTWTQTNPEKVTESGMIYKGQVNLAEGKTSAVIDIGAKTTFNGKELTCKGPIDEQQGVTDNSLKDCAFAEGASGKIEGEKLIITATANAIPVGAKAPAPTWKVGAESQTTLEFKAPADDVSEVELTAHFAVEEVGKPAVECKTKVAIVRAEARKCIVAEGKLARVTGKPNSRQISATVKMEQSSMTLKEGEAFKWQISPDLTNYDGATVSHLKDFETDKPEVKIIGMLVKGQQTLLTCEATLKDEVPVAPGTCTLSPILVKNEKGEDVLEVSLTTSGSGNEPKGDVIFSGFGFKNSKPKSASVVIKKTPVAQKKIINATYKNEAGRDFKCDVGVEIPAAEAQAAPMGPMPGQQQLPPSMPVPDIFLQGVN